MVPLNTLIEKEAVTPLPFSVADALSRTLRGEFCANDAEIENISNAINEALRKIFDLIDFISDYLIFVLN